MRLPPFDRYWRAMGMFGAFLAGMIVGAVVLNALFIAKFEAVYNANSELTSKLEQYEEDIRKLNQFKNQHTVIKNIHLRLEGDVVSGKPGLDKVSETELLKRVKEDLSIFIGRNIYDIDSDNKLARMLLERKAYADVFGKDYAVELKTVLLAENVLQVWITAKIIAKAPAS